MNEFMYQAKDASGASVNGKVRADSLQDAREAVIALGLEPFEIYQAPPNRHIPESPVTADSHTPVMEPVPKTEPRAVGYFPLLETLRLYAGWLLAWYCLIYAIGSYQFMNDLPFRLPYAESLFLSPLVLSFTFAAYLFLLFSGLYKRAKNRKAVGIALLGIGTVLFILYRMNVQ